MVPKKILDNSKGFKIEIPVYRILTLLGEFRRRGQIGHFWPIDKFLGTSNSVMVSERAWLTLKASNSNLSVLRNIPHIRQKRWPLVNLLLKKKKKNFLANHLYILKETF